MQHLPRLPQSPVFFHQIAGRRASSATGGADRLSYRINYDAILHWIRQDPCPFPPRMRAGGILYYDSIPDRLTSDPYAIMPTKTQQQRDERFWKEYIDYVLGFQYIPPEKGNVGTWRYVGAFSGYGDDVPISTAAAQNSSNGGFPVGTDHSNSSELANRPTVNMKPVPPPNDPALNPPRPQGRPTTNTSNTPPFTSNRSNNDQNALNFRYFVGLDSWNKSRRIRYQQWANGWELNTFNVPYPALAPTHASMGSDAFYWAGPRGEQWRVDSMNRPIFRSMDYRDNPRRPKMRMWFGAMSMMDFIGTLNGPRLWHPGTAKESPMWQLKVGVQTALADVRRNRPNDAMTVIGFSVPAAVSAQEIDKPGWFNSALTPLGQDYARMRNSLWFGPATINKTGTVNSVEIHPYDTVNMNRVPRAVGGTCSPYAFMLAYNQFSNDRDTRTWAGPIGSPDYGLAGGLGRRGSQKTIIFETDGVATRTAFNSGDSKTIASVTPSSIFVKSGAASHFKVRFRNSSPELPPLVEIDSTKSIEQTKRIVDLIVSMDTDDPPGFSTFRKQVKIHSIAFGSLFAESNTTTAKKNALELLQYIQFKGGTQLSPTEPLQAFKVINQTSFADRLESLRRAFQAAMQDSVSVTLIR